MSTTASAAPSPERRSARLITEVLAPANLVITILVIIGWHSTTSLSGAGWGLLAGLFCGGLPIAFIIAGARRGHWTDKHVKVRSQRWIPLGATLASVLVGTALLALLDAPQDVIALVFAMIAGLLLTMLVTIWWKVSVHTAVASGVVSILAVAVSPWTLLGYAVVAAIAWSRASLRDHTPAQTIAGAVLGAVAAVSVFTALR
ncbi:MULTISPECIES: hypothetical protein [Streptomyces]|uniref:hypothetical protein n=1 Tax=Streptomyces TaxID=1883 RepID=UPI0013BF9A4E|nr:MULTISPECIES: hypothetical protein [Streptomyces]NEB62996.1 hypothetical protein [Streptomyces diastaticus]MBZ6205837.1 hypothetical protein [Streptomyces olivaceus]MBZ6309766.1 hypothetical protein [Streptomyces olivaceus]MBZ6323551.1 hypothetical protein [Streptomyces olivaceus]MCX5039939.1 hypothetical protein [Streptomyces coelicoflavus]